jgi:fatty-acyl-CoA synthase
VSVNAASDIATPPTERPASSHRLSATYADLLVSVLLRWPDRVAFEQGGREYRYREVADGVARLDALLRRSGGGPGRGVGVLSGNTVEAWMVIAATQIGGGRFTALPTRGSLDDLVFFVNDSELSVLVVQDRLEEIGAAIVERCPRLQSVFTIGHSDLGPDIAVLREREASVPLRADPGIDRDDVCHIFYTGGTTGVSKGAAHTHGSLLAALPSYISAFQIPPLSRYLMAAPISHSGIPFVAPTLFGGGTVVLIDSFDPELFCATVERSRITFAMGVPTMVYALIDFLADHDADFSSLVSFQYGAAPISPDRLIEAQQRIGQVFVQGYGVIEVYGVGTFLPAALHDPSRREVLSSCGYPHPGVAVALLDDDGNHLADGEVGEICLRSPGAMKGYWNRPDETEKVFEHGWLHTGDVGVRDATGLHTIVDRKKDVIVSGGFNVFPAQVENVIASDPSVSMVAVIGVPDEHWGEAVKAIVAAAPGRQVDVARLTALVRESKGPVSTPKSIDIIDAMPLTAAGKIDKRALRLPYWRGTERQVN